MDYSKVSDQEINGLVMDAISDGNQAYRCGDGSAIELLHQINTVDFGEHVEREEVYAKFDPCNNPADAWPIITANRIGIIPAPEHGAWRAANRVIGANSDPRYFTQHANSLRAAMIVFLKMQDSANVPVNSTGPDLR